jgi:hypothetical protein
MSSLPLRWFRPCSAAQVLRQRDSWEERIMPAVRKDLRDLARAAA